MARVNTRTKPKTKRVKKPKAPRKPSSGVTKSCIGFLFSGALMGVVGTLLVQGMQSGSTQDVGSGLRDLIQRSRQDDAQKAARLKTEKKAPEPVLVNKTKQRVKPKFDFYTVLPAFEEVISKDAPPPVKVVTVKPNSQKSNQITRDKPKAESKPKAGAASSVYAIQVASYARHADADKLKAELSLRGWPTTIQTVAIDKKTYYRVRVGPFKDYGNLTSVDYELGKMGHKTLRLRLALGG